ncbi:MAG: ferric reductase-like transmembrane domain-containing protein [Gammaproteobacteria bacterium]|nr:ferric reductase-like transmembrane domain-containing protein [Gammaproteobacteria bacterium]
MNTTTLLQIMRQQQMNWFGSFAAVYHTCMIFLLASVTAVFAITWLANPTMGAGVFWDGGNAIGFSGFAGLLCLAIASNRPIEMTAHKILGYAVLFVCFLHAFWFLLGDAAAAEFLKPGAPLYMWSGVLGLVLLGVVVALSLMPDRARVHRSYRAFRNWHLLLAVATVIASAYHIIGNDFYISTKLQAGLLIVLASGVMIGRQQLRKSFHPTPSSTVQYLTASIAFGALFVAMRNLTA